MARRKTEAAPEPAPLLECCIAYSFDDENGAAVTVSSGARLRADHPTVLAAPDLWIDPLTTPDNERPRIEDFVRPGVQTVGQNAPPAGTKPSGLRLNE